MALEGGDDHRPGHTRPPVTQEEPARVGHAGQARVRHLEQTKLVGRPEAVLEGAQEPECVMALAVFGVLERARAVAAAVRNRRHQGDSSPSAED